MTAIHVGGPVEGSSMGRWRRLRTQREQAGMTKETEARESPQKLFKVRKKPSCL